MQPGQRVECRAVGLVKEDNLKQLRPALALLGVTDDAVDELRREADLRSQRRTGNGMAHEDVMASLAADALSVRLNLHDLAHVLQEPYP
jgi:hypothetical protein